MSSATDLIIGHLRDAQAREQQSLSVLEGHLRSAPPGPYRTAARRHLEETRRHAHGVAERLTSLGATRGPVGTALTLGEALLGRVHGAAMAPLHVLARRAGPDIVLNNVLDEIASEAHEAASYEALERLAEAVGDTTTASLARTIRSDEERYLASLRELVEPLTERVARTVTSQAPSQPSPTPTPAPAREEPSRPAGKTNGGPVTERTERETPYHDRAERLRTARREAPKTPEGPTRSQAARLREAEREAEMPVETEGAAAPGAEVHVDAPWDGYDQMKAGDIVSRLASADEALKAIVRLYEQGNKARKSVLDATA